MPSRKESWNESDVRCPFYMSHSMEKRSLACEGYMENTEVSIRFRSQPARDRHMGLYCVGRFERCPMYKCTYEAKYAED